MFFFFLNSFLLWECCEYSTQRPIQAAQSHPAAIGDRVEMVIVHGLDTGFLGPMTCHRAMVKLPPSRTITDGAWDVMGV